MQVKILLSAPIYADCGVTAAREIVALSEKVISGGNVE